MSAQAPRPQAVANGKTALIVDDDRDCLTVLRSMLENQGFMVRAAQNGRQALEQLQAEPPDIVLLDIMMPEMDGLQTLERIRNDPVTARLPVILLSAKAGDEDMLAGYQYGADYYMTKPCTTRQLQYGITLVLGKGAGSAQAEAAPTPNHT
jgi:DNA-binding response OmpR family regulator